MRFAYVLVCILVTAVSFAHAADKPNVVLIVIDDLGRNDLGCYGSKFFRTPQIDKLATEGVLFSDAYAACPVCSPSRAALLTGKHPARLHLTDWLPGRADRPDQRLARPKIKQQLPLEETTLAELFQAAGYVTGHIGKWHLGGADFGPEKQGFASNIGGGVWGTPPSYFAPFKLPGLEQAPEGEYLTDRLATEAEKFIDAHQKESFFLYLAHYAVHTPMVAKPDLVNNYPAGGPPKQQGNQTYAAMVESMDASVGRVMAKLADLGLRKNTIVVFTSDNGGLATTEGPNTPATMNSPLREGKGWLYEGGIRAPLLIAGGEFKAGKTDVPVSGADVFATLAEACQLQVPVHDGRSVLAALRGEAVVPELRDRPLFWHYPHYANQGGRPGGAIRHKEWKLIEFYETGRRELFNIKNDSGEGRNVAEENPAVVEQLAKSLDDWRKDVGAQMPTPNPDYKPHPPNKNGAIVMPAAHADVFGRMLRYEPLPHKNTLGYWVRPEDWAKWEFTVTEPQTFTVEILQGCGKGSGGTEVAFVFGEQTLTTIVEDTGHFQNFKPREIGEVKFEQPGRYTLEVRPKTKPGPAVMDLREVTLRPKK